MLGTKLEKKHHSNKGKLHPSTLNPQITSNQRKRFDAAQSFKKDWEEGGQIWLVTGTTPIPVCHNPLLKQQHFLPYSS